MSINKMNLPDTAWHIGYTTMKEGETRRHKSHCIFYDSTNKECKSGKSQYYGIRCGGSSHCLAYIEKFSRKNIFMEIINNILYWDDDHLKKAFDVEFPIEKPKSGNEIVERRQIMLCKFILSYLDSFIGLEERFMDTCEEISQRLEGREEIYYKNREQLLYRIDLLEPYIREVPFDKMSDELYQKLLFLMVITLRKVLENNIEDVEKEIESFYYYYGYSKRHKIFKQRFIVKFNKEFFAPYSNVIFDSKYSAPVRALVLESLFTRFCKEFFTLAAYTKPFKNILNLESI